MPDKPILRTIPILCLRKADWNYKEPAKNDAYYDRFKASIIEDQSAGVLAVRYLSDNVWEVIDGNHRLDVLAELGWHDIPCEDFGPISLAKAILISRRRNTDWYKDEPLKFAELFKTIVLEEFSMEQVVAFMPEEAVILESYSTIFDFNWNSFNSTTKSTSGTQEVAASEDAAASPPQKESQDPDGFVNITFRFPRDQYDAWVRLKQQTGVANDVELLNVLMAKFNG